METTKKLTTKDEFEKGIRRAVSFVKFECDERRMRALISVVAEIDTENKPSELLAAELHSMGLSGEVMVIVDARGFRIGETFVLRVVETGAPVALVELITLDEILNRYFNGN